AGVERRAARDDEDLVDLTQHVVGDPELVHRQTAVHDPTDQRVADRGGLLVDLLQHEVLEAALLRARDVPVDLDGLWMQRAPIEIGERDAFAPGLDDLTFLDRSRSWSGRAARG